MAFYQCIKLGGGTGDVADVEVNGTSVVDPISKVAEITSYEEVTESEYEAIPVAERESNGIAYFIKDLNNESVQGYPPLIYSLEEREVGVLSDGKPLYQKTFELGTLASGQNIGKSLGLANIDKIFLVVDGSWATNNGSQFPIPYVHYATGNLIGVFFEVSASDVVAQFRIGSGMSGAVGDTILTVRYTKTTDTAGSGIWNGQGGIAHHYSTSEKVVGTWIDGKPLYEKTIVYTPSEAITSSVTIATIANAKVMRVTEATGYNATDNRGYDLPDVRSSGGTKFSYDNGDVVIQTFNDSWNSSWTFYVTVQYTKTTD